MMNRIKTKLNLSVLLVIIVLTVIIQGASYYIMNQNLESGAERKGHTIIDYLSQTNEMKVFLAKETAEDLSSSSEYLALKQVMESTLASGNLKFLYIVEKSNDGSSYQYIVDGSPDDSKDNAKYLEKVEASYDEIFNTVWSTAKPTDPIFENSQYGLLMSNY